MYSWTQAAAPQVLPALGLSYIPRTAITGDGQVLEPKNTVDSDSVAQVCSLQLMRLLCSKYKSQETTETSLECYSVESTDWTGA